MSAGMRSLFRSALFAFNFHVVRQTKRADLLGLMRKLQPKNCGRDLIRIGGDADGGYLIPNDLEGIDYCFSPGVSSVSEFENQLADLGVKSFMADYSVDAPPIRRPEFTFDKKFLGASDRDMYFTLATWKEKYLENYHGDLLLQMDIEGFEYEVILNTPDSLLNQFRIITIEFHEMDRLFDAFVFRLYASCFEKLLRWFHVVHIHPNNAAECVRNGDIQIPRLMEFTFLSKRRAAVGAPVTVFPHPLDRDNVKGEHLKLPACWYSLFD